MKNGSLKLPFLLSFRADANAEAFAKSEADRKVADADDAPAEVFWEKARQRMVGGGK